MIKGYKDIYYNVKDMNRAIKFYTDAFGMSKAYGHEHWATMQLGNLNLGLHWTGGKDVAYIDRDSHGTFSGATLTFLSDNIAEDKVKIQNAGGKVIGEADQAWGHMLVFEDLDGNVLKLMNPKY